MIVSRNFPSFLTCCLNTLARICALIYLISYFGAIVGIILLIYIVKLYRLTICCIFGFEDLVFLDFTFINFFSKDNFYLGGLFRFNNFIKENVKQSIINKLIKKVPKIRSRLVHFLGDHYWQPISVNEAISTRLVELKMHERELAHFLEMETNKEMNLYETPILIFFIEFHDSSKGCLYIKCDHSISDGLGFVTLLGHLDDDYRIEKFPDILSKKSKIIPLLLIKEYLFAVIFGIFETLSYISKDSYIKSQKFSEGKSYISVLAEPFTFSLTEVKKASKKLNLTINEFCIGAFLTSFKKWSTSSEKISVMIPIGNTTLSKDIENAPLKNLTNGYLGEFNLFKNLKNDSNQIKSSIRSLVGQNYKIKANTILANILFSILNPNIMKYPKKNPIFELAITNVPAQTSKIVIGGCKVENFYPLTSVSSYHIVVMIVSYDSKLNFSIVYDKKKTDQIEDLIENYKQELTNNLNLIDDSKRD